MKYAKIIDNTIVQIQPYIQDGFIPVPDNVCAGMIKDGDNFIVPPKTPKEIAEALKEEWKASRAKAVANIKVTVNDKVFDGDEVSQGRMARTVAVLGDTEEQPWVLADNTPTMTTKAELVEALRLAGIEQTRLWIYA